MHASFIKNFIVLSTCFVLLFSCTQETIIEHKTTNKKYTDVVVADSNDYLIAVSKDSVFERLSTNAYINLKGDTIIPYGKYSHCWTDTLKYFAIVYDKEQTHDETIAIDRNENILFDIVFFDNWPDELHDGLFRVRRNGKIGFANSMGQIVIPC